MRRTSGQVLADATYAVARHDDVTDTLATLLRDCGEVLSAGAVGLVMRSGAGRTELLSSSSHASEELELFQVQQRTGPCIDAMSADLAISVTGSAGIVARWPVVGPAVLEAGYECVQVSPLHWQGKAVGALNAFFVDPSPRTKEQGLVAQAFADVATLVVMQAGPLRECPVGERIRSALAGRVVIEQAKGVLAYQQSLDLSTSYDLLVKTSTRSRASLTATAGRIVTAAQHRPQPA